MNGDFINHETFRRKNPGKNNHNASKLIEKYNDLAREALSKGDKILSENYFQHAEHFARIVNERINNSHETVNENKSNENENDKEIKQSDSI